MQHLKAHELLPTTSSATVADTNITNTATATDTTTSTVTVTDTLTFY